MRRLLDGYRNLPRAKRVAIGAGASVGVYMSWIAMIVPVMDHVALNGTESVPAHILWKTPETQIARGDYVLAPAQHPLIPTDYPYLTKYALCVEGDVLDYRDGAFFCNGELMLRVKRRTRAGAPLEAFSWPGGTIPQGKIFIGSRHPDGFDSRYLGLFEKRDLVRLEKIL